MATYVIVPGGWAGAYQWQESHRCCGRASISVHADSDGVGRAGEPGTPGVDLDLHVLDILNVLKYEKLSDVTLCADSYGGM